MTPTSQLSSPMSQELDALQIDRATHTVTVGEESHSSDSPLGLRQELGGTLYRHWHTGTGIRTEERDLRRDYPFEDLLREPIPHRTSKTEAIVKSPVLDGPMGRHVLFDIGRVRLQIPEDEGPHPLPDVGSTTTLDLPAVRPALSPGFFLVNGSAGGPTKRGPVLRIYFHVDEASTAPAVWRRVIAHLESGGTSYRAKVLAKASGYPRRDAIVLYLTEESWHVVGGVADSVRNLPGLNPVCSLLCERICDGVAYAWEPKDLRVGWDRMSFGQHRTAVVAGAVAEHTFEGGDLHERVVDALVEAGVDPREPHRNSGSPGWRPSAAVADQVVAS